jgi:hypothetical protein
MVVEAIKAWMTLARHAICTGQIINAYKTLLEDTLKKCNEMLY